ncbi:TrbC/VirB2 family protein, partial [Sphingorhabdus sp.]
MEWLAGTLLGSVATGIAVLAVAFMGFGLLGERLNWRTGALVVMG